MGRKPRVEYEGAIYHVIQRGNNREYIFKEQEYKAYILELTREYKQIMDFQLYGYVLMDNHYHMIIRTSDIPLQTIMHRINNRYSKYYNFIRIQTGHVFENRYKAILVKDDKYLLSLLKYVHQNPVKARICKNISDYKWSSDRYYRNNKQKKLVDIDFILDIFSENRMKALKEYHSFMDDEELEDEQEFEEVEFIGEKQEKEQTNSNIQIQLDTQIQLDDILISVTKDKHIYQSIKSGSRKRNLTPYKQKYIEKSLASNYTMKEIAETISVSEVAVFKLHNKNTIDRR